MGWLTVYPPTVYRTLDAAAKNSDRKILRLTSRVLVERKLVVEGEVEVIRERVVAIKFW